MKIIISPAKKMKVDTDSLDFWGLPQFLPQAQAIKHYMQSLTDAELQALWRCNDSIAKLNIQRLRNMDLQHNLTPAILAYEGIQYQYMAPSVFEDGQFDYIQNHLCILSGFYGLLRPFDGIVPYRLEMQAKLSVNGCKDLYSYWGDKPSKQLSSQDFILNLASKEYSRVITTHLPKKVPVITCVFGELIGGKIQEKGTFCKMARGEMVRFLAEHHITSQDEVKSFHHLGYTYSEKHSNNTTYVFLKGEENYAGSKHKSP